MEEGRRTKTVRLKPVNIDECVLWKLHPNSEEPRTPSVCLAPSYTATLT